MSGLIQIRSKYCSVSIFLLITSSFLLGVFNYPTTLTTPLHLISSTILLFFFPGYLVIEEARTRPSTSTGTLAYSIGISLTLIISQGLVITAVQQTVFEVGIHSIIYSHLLIISILNYRFYKKDTLVKVPFPKRSEVRPLLFLVSLPILFYIGSILNRNYGAEILLILSIVAIALSPILVVYRLIPERLFPAYIFSISISLLIFGTAYSTYLMGHDIHWEYYFANMVKTQGYWDPGYNLKGNALVSIAFIMPTFSIFSGFSMNSIFKLTTIFLFGLVPVLVYHITQKEINPIPAVFSALLFCFYWGLYMKITSIKRQQLAMIFLALILLSLINISTSNRNTDRIYLVFFGAGLIMSHYGTIFLLLILTTPLIFYNLYEKFVNFHSSEREFTDITNYFILLCVLTTSWYVYTSGGKIIGITLNIVISKIVGSTLFSSQGTGYSFVTKQATVSFQLLKILYIIVVIFIVIGIAYDTQRLVGKYVLDTGNNDDLEQINIPKYMYIYSVSSIVYLFGIMIIPGLDSFDLARVFPITLFWLAPYFTIGFVAITQTISDICMQITRPNSLYYGLVVFIGIFLLFNTGVPAEITGEYQRFDPLAIDEAPYDEPSAQHQLYSSYYPDSDISGAKWLGNYRYLSSNVTAGWYSEVILRSYGNYPPPNRPPTGKYSRSGTTLLLEPDTDIREIDKDSYIYFRSLNTQDNFMIAVSGWTDYTAKKEFSKPGKLISKIGNKRNKIYTNKGSRIYY